MDETSGTAERSLADLVDEVCSAVPATVTRRRVIATVRRCRRELDIVAGSAHPDRIRHLALRRLGGEPQ